MKREEFTAERVVTIFEKPVEALLSLYKILITLLGGAVIALLSVTGLNADSNSNELAMLLANGIPLFIYVLIRLLAAYAIIVIGLICTTITRHPVFLYIGYLIICFSSLLFAVYGLGMLSGFWESVVNHLETASCKGI